jgi:NAD+ kinase
VNKTNPQYLIIIGGDGTLVRALQKYYDKDIKIVCVNTGTVGFYAKFTDDMIDNFVKTITNDGNYIYPKTLQITLNHKKQFFCINELVVQSLNTINANIKINDIDYERFKGTGILVATRTGSTGQSRANGGAIIAPDVNAFELVEIAPTLHAKNLTINAPIIINETSKVTIQMLYTSQRSDLITDGLLQCELKEKDVIDVKHVDAKFKLCFTNDMNEYINKLKYTFIQGKYEKV